MNDNQGRQIDYLRISLTDRCNLRCRYCMPKEGIPLMAHEDILSYEEILRIVRSCAKVGITKVRLTGGEPLLRKNMAYLIGAIKKIEGISDVSITTNGYLLDDLLDDLIEAGLDRINLSLDTLNEDTFYRITRHRGFNQVYRGLKRAVEKGLIVKINAVPLRGYNHHELVELVNLSIDWGIDIRFIELMPIGCGKSYEPIPNDEIMKRIKDEGYSLIPIIKKEGNGPATYYQIPGARGAIGFISPISHQFCKSCNRVRLTAEGFLKLCLHGKDGLDLRRTLRDGIDDDTLEELIRTSIKKKPIEHHFLENDISKDVRSMNQIGG